MREMGYRELGGGRRVFLQVKFATDPDQVVTPAMHHNMQAIQVPGLPGWTGMFLPCQHVAHKLRKSSLSFSLLRALVYPETTPCMATSLVTGPVFADLNAESSGRTHVERVINSLLSHTRSGQPIGSNKNDFWDELQSQLTT